MYLLLIISAVLPLSAAYVNCKLACQRCNKNLDHLDPQIMEVYCAMCKECKERRRERLHMPFLHDADKAPGNASSFDLLLQKKPVDNVIPMKRDTPFGHREHNYNQDSKHDARQQVEPKQEPSECPTPPPCETSEEYVPVKLKKTTKTPPTSHVTTTSERTTVQTTVQEVHTCPSIEDTCRRKKKTPSCVPCMPMCMTPCPQATTSPLAPETTSATTDFYYVYVGIPKYLMKQH